MDVVGGNCTYMVLKPTAPLGLETDFINLFKEVPER